MWRHAVGIGGFCSLLAACSGPSGSPAGERPGVNEIGALNIPLTTETNGVAYRLTGARFTITGAPLSRPRTVIPPPDQPVYQETLPVGSYAIVLEDGWRLEAKATPEEDFISVDAALVSPNPQVFRISPNIDVDVVFRFATATGAVSVGAGQVNLSINVQDCSTYDQFTAALGGYTVQCLGTIGPDSYMVDTTGFLRRNFEKCAQDDSKLQTIDDILGLQYRPDLFPIAKPCIAGRWAQWKRDYGKNGIEQCPLWRQEQALAEPTAELIDTFIPLLAQLPRQDTSSPRPQFIQQLKQASAFEVFYPDAPPNQACGTPADCAGQCAGGFPGFVIRAADSTMLTDPAYWLLDTVYPPSTNPFLRRGYYHPMSYYGPAPGAIAGHRNRVPESCSHFAGGIHYIIQLKLDCLNVADFSSCISLCVP
jgi:hypothetical protein